MTQDSDPSSFEREPRLRASLTHGLSFLKSSLTLAVCSCVLSNFGMRMKSAIG